VKGFVQAGPVMIDEEQHEVICYGHPIDTTPTQYELLTAFVRHTGQVMTNEAIEQLLWGETVVDDPERLKSVIKGLRRALGRYADHIENVRGIGYRWRLHL
jgi:DNA-binding response OmpR family regulator